MRRRAAIPEWRVAACRRWCVRVGALTCAMLLSKTSRAATHDTFVNFETAPVHPIELSPDGRTLAVCNLPDARIELFDVTEDVPVALGSVTVGLDPTSIRFRTTNEIWVVNQLSDSISVVDLNARRVVATLATLDAPADVVFAGSPRRAYVTGTTLNTVQVFDPVTRAQTALIAIQGERPKALATSPDGRFVYAAISESGNGSTILAGEVGALADPELFGPVDFPDGPYGGVNPPPNVGSQFVPAMATNLPVAPPRVPLIVKKSADGRWLDDNIGDWTRFVSGEQAALSGRVPGWDLPDHDLAIVDTRDNSVRYANGLMNLCLAVAVNPVSGRIAVVGTDGINERRFEPRLQGIFHRVKLALVDPAAATAQIRDLNPHLDYTQPSLPQASRNRSVGDPRGVLWSADGTRAYVSGMGSGNVVVLDADGVRVGEPIDLGLFSGPTGLALADARHRLYVFNRFSSELVVLDIDTRAVVGKGRIFDPTPASVQKGRRHFYDTHATSGLGQAACASCHPDGRFDRLAWDLGSPTGKMTPLGLVNFPASDQPSGDHHPMKGPMTTQTLQDIIGHEPFHWRGDRGGIEDFNPTFTDLQGAEASLTTEEMADLKVFLATITFPPNPLRNFDNSLPSSLALPGQRTLGLGKLPAGAPLPNGNARSGLASFQLNGKCSLCHSLPTGLGPFQRFTNNLFRALPAGTNGAAHVALVGTERSAGLPFKIVSLRSLPDKMGFDLSGPNGRAGFGLMHSGGVDSLPRFLSDSFNVTGDQDLADLIAFLLAFTGSDLPVGVTNNVNLPPGLPSKDMPAAVGRQMTLTTPTVLPLLSDMIRIASSATGRVDLVVHAATNGVTQGWVFNRTTLQLTPDFWGDIPTTVDQLRQRASAEFPLTWMLVPRGLGKRLGIDRDEDGFGDRTESLAGTDPNDAGSNPALVPPTLAASPAGDGGVRLHWSGVPGLRYNLLSKADLGQSGWTSSDSVVAVPNLETSVFVQPPGDVARFFKLEVTP